MLLTCTTGEVAGWTHTVEHGVACNGQLLFRYNVASDATIVADITVKSSSEYEQEYYEGMARCTKCNLLHRVPAEHPLAPEATFRALASGCLAMCPPKSTATARAAEETPSGDSLTKHADGSQHADSSAPVTSGSAPQTSPSEDRITCLAASNVSRTSCARGAATCADTSRPVSTRSRPVSGRARCGKITGCLSQASCAMHRKGVLGTSAPCLCHPITRIC